MMVVPLPVLTSLAVWLLFAGAMKHDVPKPGTGYMQLVSVEHMPAEMCEIVPVSTSTILQAALRQEKLTPGAAARPARGKSDPSFVSIKRAPLRVIRDPRPTFSAVAVDNTQDEIVLQDENTFQILVYDRKANTPASAAFNDSGDVPPRWKIDAKTSKALKKPRGVALNPKNKELIVSDMRLNAVLTYYLPEMF